MLTPSELREFPWNDLTWLIVNEGELESLLKVFRKTPQTLESGSLRDRAEKELLELHECESFRKSISIICTLGAQGILFLDQTSDRASTPEIGYLPADKLVLALRDTTGAGDCFAGYFVAGLMARNDGEHLESVLHTCLAVCSLKLSRTTAYDQACAMCVERAGAMESIPSRKDVLERMVA